jgi:hypothetical protein
MQYEGKIMSSNYDPMNLFGARTRIEEEDNEGIKAKNKEMKQ